MALSDGLVGYWSPWLGSSGYRLLDRTRYANHGTLTNMDAGTDWVGATIQGRSGFALDFDGINDRVSIEKNPILGASDFTLATWVYRNSGSGHLIANQFSGPGSEFTGFRFYNLTSAAAGINANAFVLATARVSFVANNIWSSPTDSYPAGVWKHGVVVFRTGSQPQFFVDGLLVATTNWTGTTNANDIRWGTVDRGIGFGRSSQTYESAQLNGRQAENIIWNRALTASEVWQAYVAAPGGMWQDRPRRSRVYFGASGFKAYWAKRQSQLIGGGV